jgi:hypothetical protein
VTIRGNLISETKPTREKKTMPYDPNAVIEMTQVDSGDMTDIPPDLPEGEWMGVITIKPTATKKAKMPMLIIEAEAQEALTAGNEDFTGAKTAMFIVIRPSTDANAKYGKMDLKKICEAYDLPVIETIPSLSDDPPNFSSLAEWIEQVESESRKFWTTIAVDRLSGEKKTVLHFTQPGKPLPRATDDEEETPAKKPAAKAAAATAKKTNGHAAKGKNGKR